MGYKVYFSFTFHKNILDTFKCVSVLPTCVRVPCACLLPAGLVTEVLGGQGSSIPSGAGRKAWQYPRGSGFVGMQTAKGMDQQGLHQGSREKPRRPGNV